MYFLKLIRYKNLIIIAFTMYLFKYLLINKMAHNLSDFQFFLFVFSIVLIAASGNIINDIFDIKTDAINKPNKQIVTTIISKEKAYIIYYILAFLGLVFGVFLSVLANRKMYFWIYPVTIALLYVYSSYFKKKFLIGNIIVSFLTAFPILFLGLLEFKDTGYFTILYFYFLFAFLLNFAREIIKDIQDVKGDKILKMKTLAIVFGKNKSIYIVKVILVLILLFLSFWMYYFSFYQIYFSIYLFLLVVLPLFYLIIVIQNKSLTFSSNFLKIVMVLGVFSLFILS